MWWWRYSFPSQLSAYHGWCDSQGLTTSTHDTHKRKTGLINFNCSLSNENICILMDLLLIIIACSIINVHQFWFTWYEVDHMMYQLRYMWRSFNKSIHKQNGWHFQTKVQNIICLPCSNNWYIPRQNKGRFSFVIFILPTEANYLHIDVIKWNHIPRYWPFVRGIHRSRWIPRTKASDAELWCFLWSAPE